MLTICVMLWATGGRLDDLASYEDDVLVLVAEHRGRVLSRVRAEQAGDGPHEVQVLQFESERSLDEYMADPRRVAMLARRDRVVSRTESIRVEVVSA